MMNFKPPETKTTPSSSSYSSTAEKAFSLISKGWKEVRSSADADLQLIRNRAKELENFLSSVPTITATATATATTPGEIDFVKKLRPKLSEIRRAYSSPDFNWAPKGKLRIDLSGITNAIVTESEDEKLGKWRREKRFKDEKQFGELSNWEPIRAFRNRLREMEVEIKSSNSSSPVEIFEGIKNSEFMEKVKSSFVSLFFHYCIVSLSLSLMLSFNPFS